MTKHYPWLFFDADGTLFDYDRAETTALRLAFQSLDLPYEDQTLEMYRNINEELWKAFERREITPPALAVRRFVLLGEALHLDYSPSRMGATYLEHLAQQTDLIDGAYEVLQALQARSRIAIVTNGFQAVQRGRMRRSAIREFISELIISEEVGAAKPEPAFFEAAFARLGNPARKDVLMIGDSLTSDMQGGVSYGLDTCWYNPKGEPRPEAFPITYEIAQLRELLELVG